MSYCTVVTRAIAREDQENMDLDIPPAEWDDLPLANRGEEEAVLHSSSSPSVSPPSQALPGPEPFPAPRAHGPIANTGYVIDSRPSPSIIQELQQSLPINAARQGSTIANGSPSLLSAPALAEPAPTASRVVDTRTAALATAVSNGAGCPPHLTEPALVAPPVLTTATSSAELLATVVDNGSAAPPLLAATAGTTITEHSATTPFQQEPSAIISPFDLTATTAPSPEIATLGSNGAAPRHSPPPQDEIAGASISASMLATAATTATPTIVSAAAAVATAGNGSAANGGGGGGEGARVAKVAKLPTGRCRAFAAGYCKFQAVTSEYCKFGFHDAAGAEEERKAWLAEVEIAGSGDWGNAGVGVGAGVLGVPPVLLVAGPLIMVHDLKPLL